METYLVSISYFTSDLKTKIALERKLAKIDNVDIVDTYQDEDDVWNIDCLIDVKLDDNTQKIKPTIDMELNKLLPQGCWDYHYIKGVDDNFEWEP